MDKAISDEIQSDIEDIEVYLKQKIEESFPEIKVSSFFRYDINEENELNGIFTSEAGYSYIFFIPENNPYPLLKRLISQEQIAARKASEEFSDEEWD